MNPNQPNQPYGQQHFNPNQPYGQNPYQQQPYGPQPYGQPQMPKPNNYLVWNILATLFCCLPLGIAGIVYSSKVDSLWAQGLFMEAQDKANTAKKFFIWSIVSFLIVWVLYLVIMVGILGMGFGFAY